MMGPGTAEKTEVAATETYAGQHKLIICYDIPDNKRRLRVSWLLEAYGSRVQKSVFETVLNDRGVFQLQRTYNVLQKGCLLAG